ncbi:ribonuclease H-like protein [Poronia punctata]|nr:ribonuclease H-like protein [Poronia punctata]
MTTAPKRRHQLWHHTRGITFSHNRVLPGDSARSVADITTPANSHHGIVTVTTGAGHRTIINEDPVQQLLFPPPTDIRHPSPSTDHRQSSQRDNCNTERSASKEEHKAVKKATDEPPPPVLEYKMMDDMFYAAKNAPPGDARSFWSYTQYRCAEEDGRQRKVKIHYCRSRYTMEEVCRRHFKDERVLGFDLEWMPDSKKQDGLKKNVSLIQLASPGNIGLFHVALFSDSEDMVGATFRSLMEDPTVVKVGVAIKGDTTRLRTHLSIDSCGLIELSNLYKLVTYCRTREHHNINRRLVPLAKQVEEYLHLPLYKGQNVRSSDWSRPLGWDQILYSASDAYAGVQLYATLEHHRKQLIPCPPTPHFAELGLPIPLPDKVTPIRSNEGPEPCEAEPLEEGPPGPMDRFEKYLAVALETVSIGDTEATGPETNARSPEKAEQATLSKKVHERPKDSRVEVAEDRAMSYRAARPHTSASLPQLRAYYLWYHYDLPPAVVAQLLRDPPLKTVTVVQYILSVVQSEKLPADLYRLRELGSFFPLSTLWSRWPVVAQQVSD